MEATNEKSADAVAVLPHPVVTTSATLLTTAASEALASAEKAVAAARQQKALWLRAAEALALAQAAARMQHSVATQKFALEARDLANLGIQQKGYPPVRESITSK